MKAATQPQAYPLPYPPARNGNVPDLRERPRTRSLPAARRGTVYMRPEWRPELEAGLKARFRIPFEVVGPKDAPLVVAMGGISASRHVCRNATDPSAGWWRRIVGPGLAMDPANWRILGIEFLGAPGTIEPGGDDASRACFHITPGDQADALAAVLDHLGEERVHRAVGASYGGNAALAFGIRHPERTGGVVLVAAAHRPHPQATGVRTVQRAIVEFGRDHGREADGVAMARALAFTTYKTATGLDARFPFAADLSTGHPIHAVDGYLWKRGREFAGRFDARSYLTLSASIDLCDLRPEELGVPCWSIAWREDVLVPPWLVDEMHCRVRTRAHLRILCSDAGHDAFLLAAPEYSAALRESLGIRAELEA